MRKKNPHWFLKAAKERAIASEEQTIIKDIVVAISARKHKELFDIINKLEQSNGWRAAIEYLIRAAEKTYSFNIGFKTPEICLEPLKYREVIFNFFHCEGLEPVAIDTISLLNELASKESIIDAIHEFTRKVTALTWDQINKGDLLFFKSPHDNMWIPRNLKSRILNSQIREINNLILWKKGNKINIEPLWYSELGRQALSSLGHQGLLISEDRLLEVLTVIQISPKIRPKVLNYNEHETEEHKTILPSHQDYKILLNSIIHRDYDKLRFLGSKHSIPSIKCMLYDDLQYYENQKSSSNYQNLLQKINGHVVIRSLDSISILEQLCQFEDMRIATISILALGYFFHDASACVLIDLICNKKNIKIVENALIALEHLCKNNPESLSLIEKTLKTNCIHNTELKNLHRKLSKS